MSLPLTTMADPTTVTPDAAICNSATCNDPPYLLSDHPSPNSPVPAAPAQAGQALGSTSITTDVEGNLVSETRYNPWGEVRHASGLTLTDYTYTDQYSYMDDPTTSASEGFGLMFYNARWYDPGLGRFTQADTIVPLQSQGVQAWDRYAYVNNNPLRYTDPSGHYVLCVLGGIAVGMAVYFYWVEPFLGRSSDYSGVSFVQNNMNPNTDNLLVAGGIAVQSQWYGPWDTPGFPGVSSYGPAQLGASDKYSGDPTDIDVAKEGMANRIESAQSNCTGCTPTDLFIIAATSQNGPGGGFTSLDYRMYKIKNADGSISIDWEKAWQERAFKTGVPGFREWASGGLQYDTRFMLRLYLNDVKSLMEKGWKLPPGYEDIDWKRLERLASPPPMIASPQ